LRAQKRQPSQPLALSSDDPAFAGRAKDREGRHLCRAREERIAMNSTLEFLVAVAPAGIAFTIFTARDRLPDPIAVAANGMTAA
jgi:hypothetical protein